MDQTGWRAIGITTVPVCARFLPKHRCLNGRVGELRTVIVGRSYSRGEVELDVSEGGRERRVGARTGRRRQRSLQCLRQLRQHDPESGRVAVALLQGGDLRRLREQKAADGRRRAGCLAGGVRHTAAAETATDGPLGGAGHWLTAHQHRLLHGGAGRSQQRPQTAGGHQRLGAHRLRQAGRRLRQQLRHLQPHVQAITCVIVHHGCPAKQKHKCLYNC